MIHFFSIKLSTFLNVLNFLHVITAFLIIGCGAAVPIPLERLDNYPAANQTQEDPALDPYLPLRDILEQMYQLIDQEKITKKHAMQYVCSNPAIRTFFERTTIAKNKQLQDLEQLLKNLQSKKITINAFFYQLLLMRLTYLDLRDESIRQTIRLTDSSQAIVVLATDIEFHKTLFKDTHLTYTTELQSLLISQSVQRFEFLNSLIKTTFRLCNPNEFDSDTITLLKASITLHDLLRNKKETLGHPDEAGGVYAMLKYIWDNKTHFQCLFPQPPEHDIRRTNLDEARILEENIEDVITCINNEHYKAWQRTTKRIEFILDKTKESIYSSQLKNSIIAMLEKFDLYLYRGHYRRSKEHYGLYPHDLPKIPDLLSEATNEGVKVSRRKKTSGKAKPKFFSATSPNPNARNARKKFLGTKVGDTLYDPQTNEKAISPAQLATSVEEAEEETLTEEKRVEIIAVEEPEEQEEIAVAPILQQARLVAQRVVGTIAEEEIFENTPQGWTYPGKGLWSWYRFLEAKAYTIQESLHGQIQKNVNNLFSPSAGVNYSFKDFRTLWEHVEGKIIEQRGGSHRQLIGPKGEHLFGTWVPHGRDDSAFGLIGVKYLQTAALYVGYRPSEE